MSDEITLSRVGSITASNIEKYKKDFHKNPYANVIKNAVVKNGIQSVAANHQSYINMNYTFSNEIKTGKITSQKRSGRCWLFAGLNTFRNKVAKEYKIKDFELSQTYMMFWDKLEKSNYFLESIIDTLKEGIYSRIIMWLLNNPIQDGGQWDMFAGLVRKYGVIPKQMMPESYHSGFSYKMNKIITMKLRENASILRKLYKEGQDIDALREEKQKMINDIYRMLVYFLGEPPTEFDFEYRDDDDCFHSERNLTPKTFFDKYVNINLDDYISVINAPTVDKPFHKTYTVKYLGSVYEGNKVLYLNVDNETLKELAIKQLQDDEPVWFGCDMQQDTDRETGIMDIDYYPFGEVLGTKFGLSKADRLNYGESQLTHAMVFTGVNLVDDKPNRWKVENSWGEENGNKGFFIMSDSWFDQFNYQIVINKKYLSGDLKKASEESPKILPPWDPMGSLAIMK